ncbi:hypothetical protein ACFL59_15030 [Planctomycetota bacterium]
MIPFDVIVEAASEERWPTGDEWQEVSLEELRYWPDAAQKDPRAKCCQCIQKTMPVGHGPVGEPEATVSLMRIERESQTREHAARHVWFVGRCPSCGRVLWKGPRVEVRQLRPGELLTSLNP